MLLLYSSLTTTTYYLFVESIPGASQVCQFSVCLHVNRVSRKVKGHSLCSARVSIGGRCDERETGLFVPVVGVVPR